MLVIPAIDVSGGRLARLDEGRPTRVDAFGGEPAAAAAAFGAAGAQWVHVVDMDRAFTGEAAALELISEIAALGLRVQASGGISTVDGVDGALARGASRAVLGSGALRDSQEVERAVGAFGEGVAVGIDVEGGAVLPRARWSGADAEPLDLRETIGWLVSAGTARVVLTELSRVGTLEGPGTSVLATVVASGMRVLASGGVASADDLGVLARAGVEGAIVGRALYDGTLELAAALEAVW